MLNLKLERRFGSVFIQEYPLGSENLRITCSIFMKVFSRTCKNDSQEINEMHGRKAQIPRKEYIYLLSSPPTMLILLHQNAIMLLLFPLSCYIYVYMLREYGHSLPIADGHPGILFVFMHGSHHAWNTV